MKKTIVSIIKKAIKITGLMVACLLLFLFLAPVLFPGTIAEKVKQFANSRLDGELNFSKTRLSFFNHFPAFTITLYDFSLKGSAPFKEDTLITTREIALGINIKSLLFDKQIRVNKIFISNAAINVLINEKGDANYNVYIPPEKASTDKTDTSGTALKLEEIIIENSHLIYDDQSTAIRLNANGFNYKGSGDFSRAIFDLNSHAKIESLDFYFNKEPYLLKKKVDGELITQINTHSFAFFFQKNNLVINKLPIQFSGKLNFLKNGYDLDFTVNSIKSNLVDLVTALPPQYISWQQKATIKGSTDLLFTLKGKYIAVENRMPDLAFNMKIRDGYIAYEGAPFPVSNLYFHLDTNVPSLNPDSLGVKIDSLFFNIDKDYLSAVINTTGINEPTVSGKIDTRMDLEKLDQGLGLNSIDLKGKIAANFRMDGKYATGPNPKSLRHEEIILSVPTFQIKAEVKDGYFKYNALPIPVTNINFDVNASCADHDYQNTSFSLQNLTATALNSFIKGNAVVNSLKEMLMDINLQSTIQLADIKNIIPVKEVDLSGLLKINIGCKGRYDAIKKSFPVTTADLLLQNGAIKTVYYPNPVSDIGVVAKITNTTGTVSSTAIDIQPATFQFEGKPFQLQASFQNLDDIAYKIKANGTIDISRIYKVFSQKGLDLSGWIETDISLQGRQSDAMAGRYNKINNKGTLSVNDIRLTSEYFPQPFMVKRGMFTFRQDKMWFTNFLAGYGQSDFTMNGYLQNVIDYALSEKAVLKGNFNVNSQLLNIDEFMAFAPVKTKADSSIASVEIATNTSSTGVIIIPSNLDIRFTATAKKVNYNRLIPENAKANISIEHSKIILKETGFNLVGCEVLMDATYGSLGHDKAFFESHLQANEFDIQRAYNEVKLFHDMVTAAGSAQGTVSLDYKLKGRLDSNMQPVYPSLEGGGVLSVKNIKMKGFKLMSAVGNKTGKSEIKDPDLSKINIKSTVKNNVISIEQFRIKTAGFRLRVEGKTNFDGAINMKMRIGLPPFGIIGIPIQITGTQENPIIKKGKGDDQEIPEKEDNEEEVAPTEIIKAGNQ